MMNHRARDPHSLEQGDNCELRCRRTAVVIVATTRLDRARRARMHSQPPPARPWGPGECGARPTGSCCRVLPRKNEGNRARENPHPRPSPIPRRQVPRVCGRQRRGHAHTLTATLPLAPPWATAMNPRPLLEPKDSRPTRRARDGESPAPDVAAAFLPSRRGEGGEGRLADEGERSEEDTPHHVHIHGQASSRRAASATAVTGTCSSPSGREPRWPHPATEVDRISTVHPDLPEAATKTPSRLRPPIDGDTGTPRRTSSKTRTQDSRLKAQGPGLQDLRLKDSLDDLTAPSPRLSHLLPPSRLPPPRHADTSSPGRQEEDGRDHGHNERLGRLTPMLPLTDGRTRGGTRGRRATPAGRCSGPNTGHQAEAGRTAQTTLDPPRAARDADERRGGQTPGSTTQPPSPHPLPPLLLLLDKRTRRPAGRCS
jgi:hypothetical protein